MCVSQNLSRGGGEDPINFGRLRPILQKNSVGTGGRFFAQVGGIPPMGMYGYSGKPFSGGRSSCYF